METWKIESPTTKYWYNIIHATTSTAATEAAKDRAVILVLLLNTVRLVWIAPISYVVLVAATATVLPVLYSLNGNTDWIGILIMISATIPRNNVQLYCIFILYYRISHCQNHLFEFFIFIMKLFSINSTYVQQSWVLI